MNIIISKNIHLNKLNKMCSIPKDIDFDDLDKDTIIDLRTKKFSLDNISNNTNEEDLTLIIQPELQTNVNLETNMFSPYPMNNIPFSYSNSWIGM